MKYVVAFVLSLATLSGMAVPSFADCMDHGPSFDPPCNRPEAPFPAPHFPADGADVR